MCHGCKLEMHMHMSSECWKIGKYRGMLTGTGLKNTSMIKFHQSVKPQVHENHQEVVLQRVFIFASITKSLKAAQEKPHIRRELVIKYVKHITYVQIVGSRKRPKNIIQSQALIVCLRNYDTYKNK